MSKQTLHARLFSPRGEGARLRLGLLAGVILVVVLFNVVIYGLANQNKWYFYTEEQYVHTITGNTDTYFQNATPVTILFCDSKEALEGDIVYNLVWQTANQLASRYDFITVETVNIFTNPSRVEPYKYKWDEETGDYAIDPETGKRIKAYDINTSSVIFAGEGDHIVLPMSGFFVLDSNQTINAYNGEEIMASMVKWAMTDKHPVAYFTANHGETYSSVFYNRLVCAGYRVQPIDLLTEELTEDGILIISNPLYDFVEGNQDKGIRAELEKMDDFLTAGGSMYVMLDPLVTNTVRLDAFLAKWGIQRQKMTVKDTVESVTTDGYALITRYAEGDIQDAMTEMDSGRVVLRHASPLVLTPVAGKEVAPVLTASPTSGAYYNGEMVDSSGNYTLAATSRGENGGGIFVVSSVYLTAYDAMTTNEYGNRDLLLLMLNRLSGREVPMGCSYLIFSPTTLEDLTMGEARLWAAFVCVLVPLGIVTAGGIVLLRRRGR